jgi:hypothetical protein
MDRIITPTKIINLNERGKTSLVSARLDREIMASDKAFYKINSSEKLDLKVNDFVEIFGRKYKINKRPFENKVSNSEFIYDVEFEGLMYEFSKCKFFNADATGFKTSSDFTLTGNIEAFLICLKNNLKRISSKWEIGHFVNDETKTISFSKDDCFSALQRICDEFGVEFTTVEINNKYYVHTGNFGVEYPYVFEYGKGKGLYNIKLQSADDKTIVTRVYVAGGTQNLPEGYRSYSPNLKLPDAEYLEDAELIAKYGLIEGFLDFSEIYPHRTGTVSAIFTENVLKFSDSSMDFDLNEKETDGVTTKYLVPGTSAKVFFNTGNLAGYQFEIKKYDHATKTFEIIPFKNEEKLVFPSEIYDAFKIQEGDEYVILDIYMPESYVTNAENELLAAAEPEFEKLKDIKVKYDIIIDKDFLKIKNSLPFDIGDKLRVKDKELVIDKFIRINAISFDLIEKDLKVTLSDSYEMGTIRQLNFDVKKLDVKTSVKTQQTILQEQRVKDVELKTNFLSETNVSGNVIATGLLMVGDENGANAGISGITDLAEKSVRLFAGGTASNRNKALFQVLADGTVKLNHLDGKKGWVWAIKDGAPLLEYYSKSGVKLFELGERGLVASAYIPESWTETPLFKCTYTSATYDEATLKTEIEAVILKQQKIYYFNNPGDTSMNPNTNYSYVTTYTINQNFTAYEYYNGTHPDNSAYSTNIGFKNTSSSRTDNIANGWYVFNIGDFHTESTFNTSAEPTYTFTVMVEYVENGIVTQSKIITITK